MLTDDFDGKF